ncbi:MAG: hypothetical protein HOP13_03115 [Alphaproteobacteria bacterium]|nr:hypothetical protein [Alphaproteobacteria bacterium]
MIGSRVNVLLAVLAASTSLAVAAEPETQGSAKTAPRTLTPQTELPPDPATATVPTSPVEQAVPDKPGAPAGPRVTVSDLAAIDPAGAGLLSAGSGGFAPSLWSGSARPAVASRIAQLPAAPNSPAMQNLLKRVLLSQGNPPAGETPPDEPSFLAQRLQRLVANGLIDEAAMLGAQSARTDSFARQATAEAILLQGRDADACGDGTSLRQSSNDPYWLKLRVFCYLAQNDEQAAALTLNVMRERNINDDTFFTLADAIAGGSNANLAALPAPSGLHLAMMRKAGATAPAPLAGWVPGTQMLAQSADPAVRLAAMERAALASLKPIEDLRQAYSAEVFTPDQLDDPEEWAAKLPLARANALYFRSITARTVPTARAAAFAAALQRAESQNRFALFATLSAGLAQQLAPSQDTSWLAPSATRVLLYARRDKAAEQWLTVLTSPTDIAAANALQVQLGLVRPSAENLARMQSGLTWLGQHALKHGPSKDWLMERATREIPLLEALGYTIPPDAQWAVSANTTGVVPSGAAAEALTAIGRSALDSRQGETILNALVALGAGGPARAQGQTVARVVKALIAVGLRDEARALAIESVLGAPVRKSS